MNENEILKKCKDALVYAFVTLCVTEGTTSEAALGLTLDLTQKSLNAAWEDAKAAVRPAAVTVSVTGKGLAALAAIEGGADLRRYCKYLSMHGYADAFTDAIRIKTDDEREAWAVAAYERHVKNEADFRAYMLAAPEGGDAE